MAGCKDKRKLDQMHLFVNPKLKSPARWGHSKPGHPAGGDIALSAPSGIKK